MICVLGTWLWLDLHCLHCRLFKYQVASGDVPEVCPALDWHHQNVSALHAFCVILFMGILTNKMLSLLRLFKGDSSLERQCVLE